jgi:hypothetical protein
MEGIMTKWCARCKRDRAGDDFTPDASHSDGLTTYCKECRATAKRDDRRQRPAVARQRAKADYQAQLVRAQHVQALSPLEPETTEKWCPGCERSKGVDGFSRHLAMPDGRQTHCKACQREARSVKRAESTSRLKDMERCRTYYHDNLEHERQRGRSYYATHTEARQTQNKAWSAAHGEDIRNYSARRRARKAGLPDTLTTADIAFLYQYWGFACAVCGREEGLFTLQLALDHWVPITDPACPGTVPTNILLLCHGRGGCNNSKRSRDPVAWLTQRYGERKAKALLQKIAAYFALVAGEAKAVGG